MRVTQPFAAIPAELLAAVWREVCRHLDIEESARGLLPLLSERLPVEHLLVRRWDAERSRLDTVAAAGGGPWMDGGDSPAWIRRRKRFRVRLSHWGVG